MELTEYEKEEIRKIMNHLRNRDCQAARNLLEPLLNYHANAWIEERITMPEELEQIFVAIQLVENGAIPPPNQK